MAILLQEEGLYERARVYATDINEVVLQQARAGIFPLERMQEYTENYIKAGGRKAFSEYYTARYDFALLRPSLFPPTQHPPFPHLHNLWTDAAVSYRCSTYLSTRFPHRNRVSRIKTGTCVPCQRPYLGSCHRPIVSRVIGARLRRPCQRACTWQCSILLREKRLDVLVVPVAEDRDRVAGAVERRTAVLHLERLVRHGLVVRQISRIDSPFAGVIANDGSAAVGWRIRSPNGDTSLVSINSSMTMRPLLDPKDGPTLRRTATMTGSVAPLTVSSTTACVTVPQRSVSMTVKSRPNFSAISSCHLMVSPAGQTIMTPCAATHIG